VYKNAAMASIVSRTTAPTTPPTIAPTFVPPLVLLLELLVMPGRAVELLVPLEVREVPPVVKVFGGAGVSSGFRPRLTMVAWSYVWLADEVTLKKAQCGTAVPCGMVPGYCEIYTLVQAPVHVVHG